MSVEATYINQNFSQQVLVRDGNKVTFDEPNPFANEGEEVASVAHRYRRWKLDENMYLVARCEVQSVVEVNKQRGFLHPFHKPHLVDENMYLVARCEVQSVVENMFHVAICHTRPGKCYD